eukprot:1068030-Amorphochlora_amoeboformis.AAC.1
MTRGNQRETDRARAQARASKHKKVSKEENKARAKLTVASADIMRQKQVAAAKKKEEEKRKKFPVGCDTVRTRQKKESCMASSSEDLLTVCKTLSSMPTRNSKFAPFKDHDVFAVYLSSFLYVSSSQWFSSLALR